jgi:glycosyltransferase 2 family protein
LSSRLKKSLQVAGSLLGFSGVVFVFLRLSEYSPQINLAGFDLYRWGMIFLFAVIYGLANIFLARSWWYLMDFLGAKAEWPWALQAYGRSQLARYVPGNIFHFAGRQALGMAVGFSGWALAKSAVWELGLITGAGALFGLLAIPLYWNEISIQFALVLFFCAFALSTFIIWRWSPFIAFAFVYQTAFLIVSGIVFSGTLAMISPGSIMLNWFPAVCGAYIVAWLAGLITPGAPAGVGVRELVLLLLLKGHVVESDLLLAVVIGRMVTVLGDLLFFVFVVIINFGVKILARP